jgi:hypothetical protein
MGYSIVKFDGITGQVHPVYTPNGTSEIHNAFAVHTDGTIFTLLDNWASDNSPLPSTVVGIDPATGAQKFSVPLPFSSDGFMEVDGLMIAGDGYAYVPYATTEGLPGCFCQTDHLSLLRVNSAGVSDTIKILDWPAADADGEVHLSIDMITNADQGVLLSWAYTEADGTWKSAMAITTGTSVSLISQPPMLDASSPVVPVLQAQDGSFVGTDSANSWMIAFDGTGNVRWTVPGSYYPQIATADGGVIAVDDSGTAVTFDQNGNVTGMMPLLAGGVPNWGAQVYTADVSGVNLSYAWVRYASSFGVAPGGNPSGNATSVANVRLAEGFPLWSPGWLSSLLGGGPKCKLGTDKIPLGQEELSKDQPAGAAALAQYNDLKQKLLTLLGSLAPTSACATFFNANPQRAPYLSRLSTAVTNQVPYDGLLSNLSMYDAGEWTQAATQLKTWPLFKKTPQCSQYWDSRGDWSGVVASAQTQPPGTDIYIDTLKDALRNLTQATILHESLHSLTGLNDDDLYHLLSGQILNNRPTVVINTVLEQNGCAGR